MNEAHQLSNPEIQTVVLIVDDDADHRAAVAYGFRRRGYQVRLAECGEEAWNICESECVHLIITDVCMARGTGIDLLNRVRKRDKNFPLVFLMTGHSYLNLNDAASWGANAVFEKPLNGKLLLSESRKALAHQQNGDGNGR